MKLELLHISKQYGKKKAVEDMSLVLTNGVWRISGILNVEKQLCFV